MLTTLVHLCDTLMQMPDILIEKKTKFQIEQKKILNILNY